MSIAKIGLGERTLNVHVLFLHTHFFYNKREGEAVGADRSSTSFLVPINTF